MKKEITKSFAIIAAVLSFISGGLWYVSSKTQLTILHASGTGSGHADATQKVLLLLGLENKWAAWCAAAAGLLLAIGLFLDAND